MKRFFFLALLFASAVAPRDARAQTTTVTRDTLGAPNAWEIAKNPAIRDEFAVHVLARRLILQAEQLLHPDDDFADVSGTDRLGHATLDRAFILLTEAIRKGAKDPRLHFDLGEVLYMQEHHEAAADVLGKALTANPNVDGAHAAWLTFAFTNSKLDRSGDERAGYEQFLRAEVDPARRIVPLLNLAEANMRMHRLAESIDGYREVEQLSAGGVIGDVMKTGVLAVWGLAIALDRDGDARGAVEQARLASRLDPENHITGQRPIIGDTHNVYFVPAYEKYWYLALAETEDAKQANTAALAVALWGRTVALWKAYLEPAEKIDHPEGWNAIAKRHLAAAEKQLKLADDRARAAQRDPKKKELRPLDP